MANLTHYLNLIKTKNINATFLSNQADFLLVLLTYQITDDTSAFFRGCYSIELKQKQATMARGRRCRRKREEMDNSKNFQNTRRLCNQIS